MTVPTKEEALRAARVLAGLEPDVKVAEERIRNAVFKEIEATGYLGPEIAIQSWIRLHELSKLTQKYERVLRKSAEESAKDVETLTPAPRLG